MILDTLFIESLSNFVHGLSTAFFLYFGINLVFFRATNRPLFILGCLFCLWGVQDLKDLLLYIDTIGDSPYYSTILLSIDMWAVPLCALFLLEILSPGFATLRRVLLFELPLVLFTVVYIMTGLFEVYMSSVVYTTVVCALVVLFIIVRVRRYNRYMRDNYSYTERINVQWLMNSMAILAVCVCCLGCMFVRMSAIWAICFIIFRLLYCGQLFCIIVYVKNGFLRRKIWSRRKREYPVISFRRWEANSKSISERRNSI